MISVIIPTLNEEKRIAEIAKFCPKDPKVESAATGVAYELTETLNRWS